MNRSTLVVGLSLGFALGCGFATAIPRAAVPLARAGSASTRWEYTCAPIDLTEGAEDRGLNAYGAQGWEISVAGFKAMNHPYACFKRPLL